MTPQSERPWERLIRDLYRGFNQLDRQVDLLREIDRTILDQGRDNGQKSLEDLFIDSLRMFSTIHRTEAPLLCYVYLGNEFALLHDGKSEPSNPVRIAKSAVFDVFLQNPRAPHAIQPHLLTDTQDPLFGSFKDARSILLCPMFTSHRDLLSVFVLCDPDSAEVSQLKDPDFVRSLTALVQQLSIALTSHDRVLEHELIQELWNAFVSRELSPTSCFEYLAQAIPSFLPNFGPIRFRGDPPQVQVLTLVRDPELNRPQHLVIRGTTGAEYEGTRIALAHSICGLLIEDETLPYFRDDPTKPKYNGRYKSYLGQGKEIHTELAVRLERDGQLLGVLNLESELINAFNEHHVSAILDLARVVTPIVAVFERRLAMNTLMQASVTSSTARYLEGLAGVFGHASGTPLVDLNSNIQLASTLITEHIRPDLRHLETAAATGKLKEIGSALDATRDKLTRAEATLTRLSAIHSQISTLTRSFVNDINSYARPGQLDLRTLVESAVGLANSALIAKASKNIRIEFLKDSTAPRPTVFCSTLLKQHLYSILHNSVLSILDRLHSDPSPGVITIGISKHTPPASQEVTLNESWAVRIKDNGSGVTRAELEKLRRFQPGLRFRESTGHGHGLTAAQRYMASIDGRVELDSEKEKFFEVILHFPVSQDAQKAVASVETHTNA